MNLSISSQDISIILPVFNEAKTICNVIARIHNTMDVAGLTYEVIVVDDGSNDGKGKLANEAGVKVIAHPYDIGNGAAVKTSIRNATGEILVMLDGDGQHQPEDIPRLLKKTNKYDMVVGARSQGSKTSLHRDITNGIYNCFATYVCDRKIKDLTSGFRAMMAHIAHEFIPLLPDTFSYPTTITLVTVRSAYSLTYVPIKTKQGTGNSKIKLLRDGSRFLLIIFKLTTLYSPLKIFLPISALMFLLGFGYGLFKIIFLNSRYGPTSAMIMTVSVLTFLIGLVSEQIAQLRFDLVEMRKKGPSGNN